MSLVGELSYFLGFHIKQLGDGMLLSQEKYAQNLVKRFGLDSTKTVKTPTSITVKLSLDAEEVPTKSNTFRRMIWSLLYVTASSPNISFVVNVCARFQFNLIQSKRIPRQSNQKGN